MSIALVGTRWHYLSVLETKPGALRHGVSFIEWVLPPAVEAVRQQALKQPKGDRAFAEILLAAREPGLERLEVASQLAQTQGKPSAAIVPNELRQLTSPPPRVTAVETPDSLSLREEPVANCARYDALPYV